MYLVRNFDALECLPMNKIRLSIIIVNWNTKTLLKQCLDSIFSQLARDEFEVIVVDNASSDGSDLMVKEDFRLVRLISNEENKGFSKANNQGMRISVGEYILLLNSDTIIRDRTLLDKWVALMDARPEAGASGCRLVFPDGSHQTGDAGFRPSPGTIFNHSFFISRISRDRFKGLFLTSDRKTGELAVDWVCGAALLVRRSLLDRVGLLDESVYMFAEDIEFGCRITSLGYKVYYFAGIEIVHLQSGSSVKRKERDFSCMWIRNLRSLYSIYNPGKSIFFYDSVMSAGFFLRGLLYYLEYLRGRNPSSRTKAEALFGYLRGSLEVWGKPALKPSTPE